MISPTPGRTPHGPSTLPITPLLQILAVVPLQPPSLNAARRIADTTAMNACTEHPASLECQCLEVLGCYERLESIGKSELADFNGWVDRIADAPGIDPSLLSGIHGQLIAHGLLRFEFSGRARGLQYQLSPQGREALGRGSLNVADDAGGDARSIAENSSQAA